MARLLMRALLVVVLSACTTLEGLTSPESYQAFQRLDDRTRRAGGRVDFEEIGERFWLSTEIPAWCQGCRDDGDLDGLADEWEALALDRLRPALAFHIDEPSFAEGDGGLFVLGRVTRGQGDRLVVFYVFLWDDDAGRCSVARHHGDVERIVLELVEDPASDGRRFELTALYTSAHEATAVDASTILTRSELAAVERVRKSRDDDDRIVVQVAAGKHAFYVNGGCATEGSTCTEDLCAELPAVWPVVLRVHDVGEPWWPRVPPLPIDPWDYLPYCGSRARELVFACAPPIAGKLELDPFWGAPISRPLARQPAK
jgi:hypothetical protein